MILYNTLIDLSRNVFFYKKLSFPDTFETRIYLMFFHFSIMMIISKKKGKKFDQKSYDNFFHNIENNLRELGYGDVAVNKRMKELNKILYDILLKIETTNDRKNDFKINAKLVLKYLNDLKDEKSGKFVEFETYLVEFYNFCFELSLENMVRDAVKFRN
jgi:cytochrome b pre-mRNA-processing protein 3